MVKRTIKVGLLGLGTVGAGVYKLLKMNSEQISDRAGAQIEIKKILVRNLEKKRTVEADSGLLTTNPWEILHDPEIDVIVELIGGVEETRTYIEEALRHKNL